MVASMATKTQVVSMGGSKTAAALAGEKRRDTTTYDQFYFVPLISPSQSFRYPPF